jgi:hypothetical protein
MDRNEHILNGLAMIAWILLVLVLIIGLNVLDLT